MLLVQHSLKCKVPMSRKDIADFAIDLKAGDVLEYIGFKKHPHEYELLDANGKPTRNIFTIPFADATNNTLFEEVEK